MRAVAALNMRRHLLLLACCVVCSECEWGHHSITLTILLPYLINEMLKTVSFIAGLNTA